MTCSACGVGKTTARLPNGWKRQDEDVYCGKCWDARSVLRAIAMPVVEPLSGSWQEFREVLTAMWGLTTRASNWMMTELYARDVRRQDQTNMPPMPQVYLYPEARILFPGLPPQSVNSIEHAVQRKYRARRYEIIWTCASTLPTVRYPCPFPIHNQAWSVFFDTGNRPVVSARIGEKRWEFRLRGGQRYRPQLAAFRQMVEGSAKRGELALFRHADGEIICKMVAWLPRLPAGKNMDGTLSVRSTADALLVALDRNGENIWTYNADHLRRWSAEHARFVQRYAEDQGAARWATPPFASRREAAVNKYRNRMASATHEIAAALANFSARRKYASVLYDDSERGFCPQFPWFELFEKLRYKLDGFGIGLERASAGKIKEVS
jgi:hypothetical protein